MALMDFKAKKQHTRHHLFSAKRWQAGQATVEFALVLFAFLSLLAGLGAMSNFMQSGKLVEHANVSASHAIGSSDAGAWADVLAY